MSINTLANNPQIITDLKTYLNIAPIISTGTLTFSSIGMSNTISTSYTLYILDKICTLYVSDSSSGVTTSGLNIIGECNINLPSNALFNQHQVISIYNNNTGLFYTAEVAIAGGSNNLLILFSPVGLVLTIGDALSFLGFSFSFPLL